jgi:MoaA/NifB/PqqE/SkfB family radical SAM enzyme
MCSAWTKQQTSPELSVAQINKIFSDPLLGNHVEIVNLTGGEPTLRGDMVDIVRALVRKCPRLRRLDIPTNGINTLQVLDKIERTLAVLLPTPVKLCVTVSLDGVGDVHEKIRGVSGIFLQIERTIEGLKELAALYPYLSVSLNATVNRFNIKNLSDLRTFARSMGVGINFTLAALSEIGVESKAKQGSFEIEPENNQFLISFIQELIEQKEMERNYGEFMLHWLKTGTRAAPCNFMRGKVILIEPDGNTYACGNFKAFLMGNVLNESLRSLWKRKRKIPGDIKEKCRTCNSNCYMDEAQI